MKALAIIVGGLALTYAGCSARESVEKRGPPFVKMQTKFDHSEHEPMPRQAPTASAGKPFSRGRKGLWSAVQGTEFC